MSLINKCVLVTRSPQCILKLSRNFVDHPIKPSRSIRLYQTSSGPWMGAAQAAGSGSDDESIEFLKKLEKYSIFQPTPVTLHHFVDFAKNATPQTSFIFLKHELPVRLANIMKELQLLPKELHDTQACRVSRNISCLLTFHSVENWAFFCHSYLIFFFN